MELCGCYCVGTTHLPDYSILKGATITLVEMQPKATPSLCIQRSRLLLLMRVFHVGSPWKLESRRRGNSSDVDHRFLINSSTAAPHTNLNRSMIVPADLGFYKLHTYVYYACINLLFIFTFMGWMYIENWLTMDFDWDSFIVLLLNYYKCQSCEYHLKVRALTNKILKMRFYNVISNSM